MAIATDPTFSKVLRDRLDEFYADRVLTHDGVFCCEHGAQCSSSVRARYGFAAGQLSYVGDHYAASEDGRAVRILIVPMQTGEDEAPVTMRRRREQIHSRVGVSLGERNQHMMGVMSALRVLWGRPVGPDREGELLATPHGQVHVLDAYAMANSVLCSTSRPGPGRAGSPTSVMLLNCRDYLRATVERLEPTIIHSQGRAKTGSTHQAVAAAADNVRWTDEHVGVARFGSVEAVWCSLRHPARNWAHLVANPDSYLRSTAIPALERARRLARSG